MWNSRERHRERLDGRLLVDVRRYPCERLADASDDGRLETCENRLSSYGEYAFIRILSDNAVNCSSHLRR